MIRSDILTIPPVMPGKGTLASMSAWSPMGHFDPFPPPRLNGIRLLLLGLDRNEAHARSLHSFTDGLGIRRIVLLPLDEWLDVGWRHQSNGMTQLADLSCPVVRAGTGFHRDDAGRLCREKGNELPA